MSLGVALQSVFYYVVACSACHKSAYRRKRKREANQAKREMGELETEEPGLYQHPSPFSTNMYWREELALGPGPPQKKSGKSDKGGQRQLLTGSSVGSSNGGSLAGGKSSTEMQTVAENRLSGDNWNRRRYQREDEELWGHGERPMPAHRRRGSNVGSSIGLVGLGEAGRAPTEKYYTARNPPVNELHPPVVSTQPANKAETRWMLQPPPSAKVMSGKERANVSRSDSGASRAVGEPGLARHVGERLMEEGQRRRPAKRRARTSTVLEGQGHDRDKRASTDTVSSGGGRRQRRPPPISVSDDSLGPRDVAIQVVPPDGPGNVPMPPSGGPALKELAVPSSALNTRSSSPHLPKRPAAAAFGSSFPGSSDIAWHRAPAEPVPAHRRSMDL
ncbi:MAG: hypothetical protein M1832_004841 [Thelocarpon impressellum]|nr:MAG: hypothetical protein M1832_004841 [Thelocarpon impressellum]